MFKEETETTKTRMDQFNPRTSERLSKHANLVTKEEENRMVIKNVTCKQTKYWPRRKSMSRQIFNAPYRNYFNEKCKKSEILPNHYFIVGRLRSSHLLALSVVMTIEKKIFT